MRRVAVAIAAALLIAGCTDDDEKGYAPENCQRAKPDSGHLIVRCTIDRAFPRVAITVFEGDYELNEVVFRDTLTARETDYEMPVDHRFTVMAFYPIGRDTVLVIDTAELGVGYDEYEDATCYYVDTRTADVRLRD